MRTRPTALHLASFWLSSRVIAALLSLFVLATVVAPARAAEAVVNVATGLRSTFFIKSDRTLWAMGANVLGQLGDGTNTPRIRPVQVATDVVSVAAGPSRTWLVKADGTLWQTIASTPMTALPGVGTIYYWDQVDSGVVSVVAGNDHAVFLKADGSLWTVGLDVGTWPVGPPNDTPKLVATDVASAAAAFFHTLFVKKDGTLWAVGDNRSGCLGGGTATVLPLPVQVATAVRSVTTGDAITLFIKTDGSLWGMGGNNYGQLGDGTTVEHPTPVLVAADVLVAAAGGEHSLFIKADGTLWGMGLRSHGALGDNLAGFALTPEWLTQNVAAVAAAYDQTLFVKQDGTLWAMGTNTYGELGYPPSLPTPAGALQIIPAQDADFAITLSSGTTAFTEARNTLSPAVPLDAALVLSAPPTAIFTTATVSLTGNYQSLEDTLAFQPLPGTTGNIAATFDRYTGILTLTSASTLATRSEWETALRAVTYHDGAHSPDPAARTATFALSNGLTTSVPVSRTIAVMSVNDVPTDITLSSHLANPLAGANATIGTLSSTDPDDTTFTYTLVDGPGSNDNTAFNLSGATLRAIKPSTLSPGRHSVRIQTDDGHGGTFTRAFTINVTPLGDLPPVAVASGGSYTALIRPDGALQEMGRRANGYGAYGIKARDVKCVAAGSDSQMAFVTRSGGLWVCGYNNFGVDPYGPPVRVATDVASVAVDGSLYIAFLTSWDSFHTLFVKTDGTLWGVGYGFGLLGDGTTLTRTTPVQIATGVTAVVTAEAHSLFLKTDGTLWETGYNSDQAATLPVRIADQVASVSTGQAHTMFVKIDHTLWATGSNSDGQLGDGTTTSRAVPEQVASNVALVSAGGDTTLFVKTDGTLWGMGKNESGQLGDGTTTTRLSPVQIASGVLAVSTRASHTIFARNDGTFWGMGTRDRGELGWDASPLPQLTPVEIVNPIAMAAQPSSQTAMAGQTITFLAAITGGWATVDWRRNGLEAWHAFGDLQPAQTGLISVDYDHGIVRSEVAILGLLSATKTVGDAKEIQGDIYVPANGHTFDQVLLTGPAASITSDHAAQQITRMSFIDLTDDIVQVELSGPGTLSLVLANPTGPANATNYLQPDVRYMRGHAGIVVAGATKDTHVSIFSVGRITAVNQSLFRPDVTYDGMADIAFIAILSSDGKFGGLRTANVSYFATHGLTGVYAPGVEFTGPVYLGDISAADDATPVIRLGSGTTVQINGGDLYQANDRSVQVSGFTHLNFVANVNSHGAPQPAQPNRAVLEQDGVDVTAQLVSAPAP